MEIRNHHLAAELRADGDNGKLVGYAAVFNTRSENLGGFVEVIQPGAFAGSLDGDDIRALIDHEGIAIARTKNGTLALREDNKGLLVEIDLPDTTDGRDIRESVRRGDVDQMSFGFFVREGGQVFTEDEDGTVVRTLTDVRLLETSIVTFPAYPDTSVATRSVQEWRDGQTANSLAELADKRRSRMSRKLQLTGVR